MKYKGWDIYGPHLIDYRGLEVGPTGRWTAHRHGVSMCGNSESLIQRMIDLKKHWWESL